MIVTLTMNPAIDKTLVIQKLKQGALNRVIHTQTDAGGNGINICRALKVMGSEAVACGFIAGMNGRFIKDYLLSVGIPSDFIEVRGETRVNLKIVEHDGTLTDINEAGFEVTDNDFSRLCERMSQYIRRENTIILCGSTPPNFSVEKYHILCEAVKKHGSRLFVDTRGEYLLESLKSQPFFIKPSAAELSDVLDCSLKSIDEVKKGAAELIKMGAQNVAVSMGAEGALFMNPAEAYFVEAPQVEILGPTGAGDVMVAGIAHAIVNNMDFENTARYSVAAASASVAVEGTSMATRRSVLSLYNSTYAKRI